MGVKLSRIVQVTEYHDPVKNFELVQVPSEVRYDPFTGEGVRIFSMLKTQLQKYDWTPVVQLSKERFCPFCPGVLEKATPRFPENLVPGGHLKVGEAVVIPNMFPCEPYSGVVVISTEHYLPMTDITTETLTDGLTAGILFLKSVQKNDGSVTVSLNWNYMPHGGGSIIHPHFHAMAGKYPTVYQGALLDSCSRYYIENGGNMVSELLKIEKEIGERYLGSIGNIHWLATFAPRGMADVTAIFENRTTLEDITEQDIDDFVMGIRHVLGFYDSMNLSGFNMSIFPGRCGSKGYWVMARFVGRFVLHPLGGSDMTQYQVLHGVNWSFIPPETIAGKLMLLFNK